MDDEADDDDDDVSLLFPLTRTGELDFCGFARIVFCLAYLSRRSAFGAVGRESGVEERARVQYCSALGSP